MSWLSSLFGGGSKSDGGSSNQAPVSNEYHVYDPLQADKQAVSTPLSQFLAGSVGKGIGEGPAVDQNYTNRYNEFLQVNPSQYFDENIGKPAYEQFTKYARPTITEGYAGALRGSGRYGAEEAGYVGLAENLGNAKSSFVPSFAQAQLGAGQTEFSRRYLTWYQSLPETNPVLAQAINFLNGGKQNADSYNYDTVPGGSSQGGSFLSQLAGMAAGYLGNSGGGSGGQGGMNFSSLMSLFSNSQSGANSYSGATGVRDDGTQITI